MIGALMLRIGSRRGWAAVNRRDLDHFDSLIAEDIVYDVAGEPPLGGHFVGKAAWREANERWMEPLASFRFRVLNEALTRPLALGLTNVVLTEYELIERTRDGRELRTRGIDVSEIRRGKVVAERNCLFDLEAEAALRRPSSEAGPSEL